MWIWLISAIAFLVLVVLVFGYRRVNVSRRISPQESIEDIETVQAYDKISRWPQFRLLRMIIVGELKKHNPNGVLVDVGCGPGLSCSRDSKVVPAPNCHWSGYFREDDAKGD